MMHNLLNWGLRPVCGSMALLLGCLAFGYAQEPEKAPVPRSTTAPVIVDGPAGELDRKVLSEIKDRSEIMKNLRYISDDIGHRLTGSASLKRANEWTAEKFKSYGLEKIRLDPWEIPVGWERGPATMKLLGPIAPRELFIASRGWTPGTKGTIKGPVVFIEARTKADLEKYKGKLKNAVIMRSPPTFIAPVGETGRGPAPAPMGGKREGKKDDTAAKKDAKGDAAPSANQPPRPNFADMMALRREMDDFLKAEGAVATLSDSGKPHGLLVTTGGWREGDRGTPQDPLTGLFMAHEHYDLLYRLATAKGAEPPMVELNVSNKFIPGPVECYNTVGEVRGSEKPDEFVVLGAHLDSWDLASGTTDNGTGSSVILECARVIAKLAREGHPPKRTIRFVLFTGEEQGLYGSKRYVERYKDEMPKTSVAMVHDTGTGKVLGLGLQGRAQVMKLLEPELASLKNLDGWKGLDLGSMGGTDHLSFEAYGVPGFACRQDPDEYRFTHHTQSDTFDKAKEPNLVQGASVLAVAALRVANLPDLLPRERPAPKKSERKQ
jgi:carboxypeptidase Q